MSELLGTKLASGIVPFSDLDTFPTHYAKYGKGGFRSVSEMSELESIPKDRCEEGMLVYVVNDPSKTNLYQYLNGEWVKSDISSGIEKLDTLKDRESLGSPEEGTICFVRETSGLSVFKNGSWVSMDIDSDSLGIPVLNKGKVDELERLGKLPTDYITIPDPGELELPIPKKTVYTDKGGGYYLDILFSSIKALQSEVAKIRNTFDYGLYSYTGKSTSMSTVMDDLQGSVAEEPLWAIDEGSLLPVPGVSLTIGPGHELKPTGSVRFGGNGLEINKSGASWIDPAESGFSGITNNKQYVYLTTSGTRVKFKLKNLDDTGEILEFDLGSLGLAVPKTEKYNILFVLSRSMPVGEDLVGDNLVWISVEAWGTEEVLAQGYWRPGRRVSDEIALLGSKQDSRFTISEIRLEDLSLYKFVGYTKEQDFSKIITPSKPDGDDYKYRVAHITIRSVRNEAELREIQDQLPKNELIYNEATSGLWIKTSSGIKSISHGKSSDNSDDNSGMNKNEILEWLSKNGIHVTEDANKEIRISNLGGITFIHQGTGKAFKLEATADGKLHTTEIPGQSLENKMISAEFRLSENTATLNNIRGFIGTLGEHEFAKSLGVSHDTVRERDIIGFADRLRIGSVYAPSAGQKVYGCSHAFVELENTSHQDIPLSGCYLHFASGICTDTTTGQDAVEEHCIALSGVIPAGGTYLIRGKQYTDTDQANCFIKVDNYDLEWYWSKGEGADFSLSQNNTFLLTYGLPGKSIKSTEFGISTVLVSTPSPKKDKAPWSYHPGYIDSLSIGSPVKYKAKHTWTHAEMKHYSASKIDCIYKNTFELDPARQAFQACNGYDSSRKRNENEFDFQYLLLDKEYIEFPYSDDKFPVSRYTPKASFEKKNVSTDKTKLDMSRPNMVTVSFGIDLHRTRCFNWISAGLFDEFVWIREAGTETWSARFESYKPGISNDDPGTSGMVKKDFTGPGYTFANKTTRLQDNAQSVIYNRMTGIFPGSKTLYTGHKAVIDILPEAPGTVKKYEYIVGRADKSGQPDLNHTSKVQRFTLYPTNYTPRVFQVTDQQGFHWVDYQVWAAASKRVHETIKDLLGKDVYAPVKGITAGNFGNGEYYTKSGGGGYLLSGGYSGDTEYYVKQRIIPVLINTGDMTQNGTRINEWLDYYNAGYDLFSEFEQMNIVGNNDLCGPDPEQLGTGDDAGKSNAYYFHLFYCYEVPSGNLPIISNTKATRYVPSLYYFESTANPASRVPGYRFVMINTEITTTTCKTWFKQESTQDNDDSGNPLTINVYTGWPVSERQDTHYDGSFTTVYSMIKKMLYEAEGRKLFTCCHEMPFTVITNHNLKTSVSDIQAIDRSISGKPTGPLVGSHCNRLGYNDTRSINWLSRLFEGAGVKICIGGHKHTYVCTRPILEYYYYDNGTKNSKDHGPMMMPDTLQTDTASWTGKVNGVPGSTGTVYTADPTGSLSISTTKFPLMKVEEGESEGITKTSSVYYPFYGVRELRSPGVTYFLCQATGAKLKSNKELPSPEQKFSLVIPKTTVGERKDSPDGNQQRPMFSEVTIAGDSFGIYLSRIENIMDHSHKHVFNQVHHGTAPVEIKYLKAGTSQGSESKIYGSWNNTEKVPLTVI